MALPASEEVEDEEKELEKPPHNFVEPYGFGWRHIVTLLSFLGVFMVYTLRVNLSVGLVAMLNHTAIASHSKAHNSTSQVCPSEGNSTAAPTRDGPYDWDEGTQGLILGSFFYGYIVTQIPGGWAAERWGAKWVFGLGTLWTSLLTLATPLAASWGVEVLVALRVMEGLGEGVTFPALNALFAQWAVPSERSTLPAFAFSGAYVGTVFSFIASGYMCNSTFLGGWPSVFYVFGGLGCLWFIAWAALATSSPRSHPFISEREKGFVASQTGTEGEAKAAVPLTKILSSLPVWAIIVSHTSNNWGGYTLLTELPSFLKDILGFDLKANGVISALPYIAQFVVQNIAGVGVDWLRRRLDMTEDSTKLRKAVDCLGHLIPGLLLIGVGYVGCNRTWAVALLVASIGSSGLNGGGYLVNHLDLSPRHAGFLFGLSNCIATIPGFAGPALVGAITNGNDNVAAWRKVFGITAGVYFFSVVFYALFASGKRQPWADDEETAPLINREDFEREEEQQLGKEDENDG